MFGRHHDGLEVGDEAKVARLVPRWGSLGEADRSRLLSNTDVILRTKRWEAANGFALTHEIRLAIAAQAAVLLLGLDADVYRHVRTILVHPSTIVRTGVRAGPVRGVVSDGAISILGESAHGDGPVSIAWDTSAAEARHPEFGHNVVFHEFAHKIDMLDGIVDGTPPIPDGPDRDRWIGVCTELFARLRDGEAMVLRPYAGVSPGEFFAVATEVFFTTPRELLAREPGLYSVLRGFYRWDPAATDEINPG